MCNRAGAFTAKRPISRYETGMNPHSPSLDELMEKASVALSAREYLACEAMCMQALELARGKSDWAYYARILLPLQEARRHRRTLSAEGFIRLGILAADLETIEKALPDQPFCLVLTHPGSVEMARRIQTISRENFRFAQILWADNAIQADHWVLRSMGGVSVEAKLQSPPASWCGRWLNPCEQVEADSHQPARKPGDWVIDAVEALGDAALAQVNSPRVHSRG
ncbi:MAG: hypothetical protein HC898_02480 [Phycisphaerales bacterium]|nr:hypothetical protein [Phycisphaerales bacterium]